MHFARLMLNVWKGHSVHKMCLHIGSGLFGRFVSSLRLTLQQRMSWVEDLRNFSLLLSFFLFFFTFYHSAHSLDYLLAHQVNIYRSEFPGLRANWILCDAAGGTQVLSLKHPESYRGRDPDVFCDGGTQVLHQ